MCFLSWPGERCGVILFYLLRAADLTSFLFFFLPLLLERSCLIQVRSTAVKRLVDLVNAEPTVLPKNILEAVGNRIKDRKVTFTAVGGGSGGGGGGDDGRIKDKEVVCSAVGGSGGADGGGGGGGVGLVAVLE